MMPNLPWWAWPVLIVVWFPVMWLAYLWWAAGRAVMDTDLWEGGDPDARPLDRDGSLLGLPTGRRM